MTKALTFVVIASVYWLVAAVLLFTTLLGTCGMGPEATCHNGGLMSFWSAAVGFSLIFVSFSLVFFRRKPRGLR